MFVTFYIVVRINVFLCVISFVVDGKDQYLCLFFKTFM